MQKVERKKHRDSRGRTGLWVLLFAVFAALCAAGLFLLNRGGKEPLPVREDRGGAIVDLETDQVASVTVTRRDGSTWTAQPDEDGDLVLPGEDWAVDAQLAARILDAAANLVYEDVLTDNPADYQSSLADFGLNPPALTAEIAYTDGSSVLIRIGDAAILEERTVYYALLDGDSRLFALPQGVVDDLNMDRSLLHPVDQPVIHGALLDRITVLDASGAVSREWRLRGSVEDQDAGVNWVITEPIAYPADETMISNMKKSAENLRVGLWVGPATPENLNMYGFDSSPGTLTLHMAAGSTGTVSDAGVYDVQDWEEREVSFRIGSKHSEMTDYVLWEDSIYTISSFTLEVFTSQEPFSSVARYPVLTPLNSLESLTVETLTESGTWDQTTYQIDRGAGLAAAAPADGAQAGSTAEGVNEADTVLCVKNDAAISWETFSADYERLLTVTVSGRLPNGWEKQPSEKKYTFRTVSGGTHTLELSPFDPMHDAVTVDGYTLFYLIRGGMTDLP